MLIMFVNLVTIQWAGTPVFLVAKPCLLAKVLDYIRTTLWGRVWIKQGKLDLQTLIIFTGYIVSACTSQTLLFGYMRSTWLKKNGYIFHKPVQFVGFSQTRILVNIISNTQQKSKSSYLIWIFFLIFDFTFYHFFVHATCTIELNSMGERISPCIHRL